MQSSQQPKPFLIGVAGGTASGKSTVCKRIIELLGTQIPNHQYIFVLSVDSFYKDLTEEDRQSASRGEFDLDHPSGEGTQGTVASVAGRIAAVIISIGDHSRIRKVTFNFDHLFEVLKKITNKQSVEVSEYDHRTYGRNSNVLTIPGDVDVVLVEGILTFYRKDIRDLFHMKLFVDSDADTRLSRRVLRDTSEKGRDLNFILNHYFKYVKPAFEEFCLPTKKYADVILPRGADNTVGIDLIVQHIQDVITHRSIPRRHDLQPQSPATVTNSSKQQLQPETGAASPAQQSQQQQTLQVSDPGSAGDNPSPPRYIGRERQLSEPSFAAQTGGSSALSRPH